MHTLLRTVLRLLIVAAMLSAGAACRAQFPIPGYPDSVTAYDPREVAMLPPFCLVTQEFRSKAAGGGNRAEYEKWRSVMGDMIEHMHHYCWGLMKTNRGTLLAREQQARNAYLSDSIGEFDYVIQHAQPDFIMLPEILARKGQNQIRLGKGPTGLLSLEQAIQAKPDYWPPYAYISDYYRDLGERQLARDALQRGLAAIPDSVALKRRLDELERTPAPARRKPNAGGNAD